MIATISISVKSDMSTPRLSSAQRCGWIPAIEKVGEDFRLVIMYRDARGNVFPFSKSPKNAPSKLPWGSPDSCSVGVDDRDDTQEVFFR